MTGPTRRALQGVFEASSPEPRVINHQLHAAPPRGSWGRGGGHLSGRCLHTHRACKCNRTIYRAGSGQQIIAVLGTTNNARFQVLVLRSKPKSTTLSQKKHTHTQKKTRSDETFSSALVVRNSTTGCKYTSKLCHCATFRSSPLSKYTTTTKVSVFPNFAAMLWQYFSSRSY